MIIFDANLKKYEIFWILQIFIRISIMALLWTWLRLKNVIHSTLFRKIVIETQCIDCINDHFWCQFEKLWNFLEFLYDFFEFSLRHCQWTFWAQKYVAHSTIFPKIVIETQCIDCHKWSLFDANLTKYEFFWIPPNFLNFH